MTEMNAPSAASDGITGRSGAADEQGTCALPDGKSCDADAYYGGTCGTSAPDAR